MNTSGKGKRKKAHPPAQRKNKQREKCKARLPAHKNEEERRASQRKGEKREEKRRKREVKKDTPEPSAHKPVPQTQTAVLKGRTPQVCRRLQATPTQAVRATLGHRAQQGCIQPAHSRRNKMTLISGHTTSQKTRCFLGGDKPTTNKQTDKQTSQPPSCVFE